MHELPRWVYDLYEVILREEDRYTLDLSLTLKWKVEAWTTLREALIKSSAQDQRLLQVESSVESIIAVYNAALAGLVKE